MVLAKKYRGSSDRGAYYGARRSIAQVVPVYIRLMQWTVRAIPVALHTGHNNTT